MAMLDDLPPLDTALLRQVGGPLGTNPAGVYEDAAGRRYYVKTLETPAHARNERLAAQLYALAGAPTLDYLPCRDPRQIATVLVHLDKRHVARLDAAERRQAQRWLGVHAWTANWDAAGFEGDNQGVAGGVVLTLDVGGALEFRAQGEPKGAAFGRSVGELDALRRDPDNPHAVRLFGDMSAAQVREAIDVVASIPDERIWQALSGASSGSTGSSGSSGGGSRALANKLIARKADLVRRLGDASLR